MNDSASPTLFRANGARIRDLRKQLLWDQKTLATKTTLSVKTISRAEQGETSHHMFTFRAVAKAFQEAGQPVEPTELCIPFETAPPPVPAKAPAEDTPVTLQRKEVALQFAREWPSQTTEHRLAIEKARPGTFVWNDEGDEPLSDARAREIYCATGADSEDFDLRFHLIEMLNYFELIATAYRHNAADRAILEEQFRDPLVRWHRLLQSFIDVVWDKNNKAGLRPWEPYVDLVAGYWQSRPGQFRTTRTMLEAECPPPDNG